MEERFEVSAYFYVEGFPSVAGITEQMGVSPSKSWNQNDPDPKPYLPDYRCECSYWELLGPQPLVVDSITAHLDAILGILEARKQVVQELSKIYRSGIICSCYFPDTSPSFKLDAELIERCADLKLSIDFELSCSRSDENEDDRPSRYHNYLMGLGKGTATVDSIDEEEISF